MAYTKGPWSADHNYTAVGCENEKIGGFAKLFDVRGWGYLTGRGHGGLALEREEAYEIQKSNARLIAAAPDLDEAAKEAWRALAWIVGYDSEDKILASAMAKIEAARMKAGTYDYDAMRRQVEKNLEDFKNRNEAQ